ncbi:proline-rich protein 33 isoform X2 [Bombina bombina]|uniref:proline-rich protein 33 isoform X2 n=1 Tax=Bombina bombina TaxID=8345 RepID=UPI00235A652D|nr:proline-rich protein 33 isoform X2 [Bombina bombina]
MPDSGAAIMLLTVTPLVDPGPPSPTPPPTAPKPPKDNAKLQRLMKKASKRTGVQASPTQPHKAFRSTLSPVNEGEWENLEPTAPRKLVPPSLNLPPRFQIRGLTHRVPSPYPKHRGFTFTVVEQHSLNQFLNSPPPYDTPSPRPPDANIPDVFTRRDQANETHPSCSPGAQTSPYCLPETPTPKPTTPTPSLVSQTPSHGQDATAVFYPSKTPQKSCGSPFPKIGENKNQFHNNHKTLNAESSSSPKPETTVLAIAFSGLSKDTGAETPTNVLADQSVATDKQSGCSPPVMTPTTESVLSSTPEVTEITRPISSCFVGTDIPPPTSAFASDTTQSPLTQRDTEIHGGLTPLPSGTTCTNPASKNKISLKNHCTPKTDESDHTAPSPVVSSPKGKAPISEEMNLLKKPERPRPPRRKPGGGWARLVKHLVVEPEEPKFPESHSVEVKDETGEKNVNTVTDGPQPSRPSRANKMWDALLYHMSSTSSKTEEKSGTEPPPQIPFLRFRLPLLLHRPRFDARKLKEAASRPLRRVSSFFHRKTSEQPISNFNRTASGWSIRGDEADQGVEQVKEMIKV